MYKVGEYVVYRKDVCFIKRMKKSPVNQQDYYVLQPVGDDSLIIEVPVEDRCGLLRPVMTKEEVESLIAQMPSIPVIEGNDRVMENQYKALLNSNDPKDLICIIKTTYARNQLRLDNNKKIAEKDDEYFKKTEQFLYNEFSVALGLSFDETKKYVLKQVLALEKNKIL